MKRIPWLVLLAALACSVATGQTFPSYFSAADLSLASPGALKFGLYGYDNPALLATLHQADFQVAWTDATGRWNDFNRWGVFGAIPHLGLGAVTTKEAGGSITDYRVSAGLGDRSLGIGAAYSFAGGDKNSFDRRNSLTVGMMMRPDPHLSLGLVGSATTSGGASESVVDLGFRPFGNEWLTAFADYGIQNGQLLKEGSWSCGAAVEALPGIRITGRMFDSHAFAVGLSISLGGAGVSAQSTFDRNAKHSFNTYALRLGAYDRTVLTKLMKRSKYVEMNLYGEMKYRRFILFDDANTLRGTLEAITAARDDETVAGIAINLSGMSVNREMIWEIREQLKEFKAAGKKVIVFIDTPSLEDYHLASVADRIVIDPQGMIALPGYAMGLTYLKGTLEKLGIGFDEWRFFKYKSANEMLSRDGMSEGDREQRQKYIDDLYAIARADISSGRKLSLERFDQIINDEVLFLAQDAVSKGLADTLGRWEDARAMIERLEGGRKEITGAGALEEFNLPPDGRWGELPRIAVIYALGECAMDSGIKARSLINDVEDAAADPRIKAIVLRVDSPGGDALASDYIAEGLKRAKRNKPVIVSQGLVAGSGGYWLSMYGDTIVAAPGTVTGSIGVAGGWLYNKDLKEKLGMSTDLVKAGTHADLGFGFRLPLLGLGLPDRNLSDAERSKAELSMRTLYANFVGKVASGRKTTPEKIEPIAQGRFYSGSDGKKIGLVDVLGGIETAMAIAKQKAGIGAGEDVTVVEYPKPGLFDFSSLRQRLFGIQQVIADDPVVQHLKFRIRHNGSPMPLMPPEQMELDVPTE